MIKNLLKQFVTLILAVIASNAVAQEATFSQIKSIFQASCAIGCHNSTDNSKNNILI